MIQCQLCNSRFIRPSHLKAHLKIHEKGESKCDYCSETFLKLAQLLAHINEKHKQLEKIFRFLFNLILPIVSNVAIVSKIVIDDTVFFLVDRDFHFVNILHLVCFEITCSTIKDSSPK